MEPPPDPRMFPPGDPVGPVRAAGPLLCPGCGETYGGETRLCVRCGIDLHTGERLAGDGGGPEPDLTETERPPWWAWLPALCPGFFRLKTLVLSVILLALAAGCFVLCLVFLAMGVLFTSVSAGGVGVILYAQAVAWVLTGEVELLQNALAEFDGTRWSAFFFALAVPFTGVLAFVFWHGGPTGGD